VHFLLGLSNCSLEQKLQPSSKLTVDEGVEGSKKSRGVEALSKASETRETCLAKKKVQGLVRNDWALV
jgi:hypothetical protein